MTTSSSGHYSRRQFVKNSALAAAALGLKTGWAAQAAETASPANPSISLQLYSIRNECQKDFDDAMGQVAKMGFEAFEFAGYYKYQNDAKGLRQKLDDVGVRASGTHIGTSTLRGDALKQTIEFHQTLGCKYLIVPQDGDYTHPDKSKALADTFNKAAEVLKPLGMFCGMHNHTDEFKKEGDKTYFDLFAERTSKEVVLQIDCGWAFTAGYDPAELMKKNAGRIKTTHFKPTVARGETAKKALIGQDSVDWVKVLAACRRFGGTEWVVVEQEEYPDRRPAMECTADSLSGLKKIW